MNENPVVKLNDEYQCFLAGKIDRRQLLQRAGTLGISAAALSLFGRVVPASAQEASPAASPTGDLSFTSITGAEADAQIRSDYPFSDPASTGGVVIIGIPSGIAGTNMMLAADSVTLNFMALVNEYLLKANPMDGQMIPGLADSWEIAADGKTYTFHLTQGVAWHDGVPFSADDVILSLDAQAAPDSGSSYTSTFLSTVASYRKIDDLTIEMVATDVFAQVVFLLYANVPVMPKHIWGDVPFADWATDPGSTGSDPTRVIGTGPFTFDSIDDSTGNVTLNRNDHYYRQIPVVDQVKYQVWPDEIAVVEALRAGDIDIIQGPLQASDAEALRTDSSFKIDVFDTYDFYFLGFNLDVDKTMLFQDLRTRQALMYGIDRQSMVDNLLLGYGEVAHGTQPVLSIAYAPDKIKTHYGYDPEKAKQLLADAGWVDDGGTLTLGDLKLEFSVSYGAGSSLADSYMAYIQEAWSQIGVKMQPSPVDFSTVLLPMVTGPSPSHAFDIFATSLSWDASADQSAMFSTSGYDGGFNVMKYSNPEVDKLNAEANAELDVPTRIDLLVNSANLVNEDLPLIIIYFGKSAIGSSSKLNNFFANVSSDGFWSLPYVWIGS